jgi:hypothetical protein
MGAKIQMVMPITKNPEKMTMLEHAQAFYQETYGVDMPAYSTEKGKAAYEAWVNWAFDFSKTNSSALKKEIDKIVKTF